MLLQIKDYLMLISTMIGQEYTLEEISYSRKEDCRVMEAVLSGWFKNPKVLNFVDPNLTEGPKRAHSLNNATKG